MNSSSANVANVSTPPVTATETSKNSDERKILQLRDTLKKKKSKILHMTSQMEKKESTISELKAEMNVNQNDYKMNLKMKDLEIENLKSRLENSSSNQKPTSGIDRMMEMQMMSMMQQQQQQMQRFYQVPPQQNVAFNHFGSNGGNHQNRAPPQDQMDQYGQMNVTRIDENVSTSNRNSNSDSC